MLQDPATKSQPASWASHPAWRPLSALCCNRRRDDVQRHHDTIARTLIDRYTAMASCKPPAATHAEDCAAAAWLPPKQLPPPTAKAALGCCGRSSATRCSGRLSGRHGDVGVLLQQVAAPQVSHSPQGPHSAVANQLPGLHRSPSSTAERRTCWEKEHGPQECATAHSWEALRRCSLRKMSTTANSTAHISPQTPQHCAVACHNKISP